MYLESRTKRILAIACLGKKLTFYTEIFEYFEYLISKKGLFHRVKELLKWNQTRYAVSPVYVEFRTKKNFCYCLPRKKVSFSYGILQLFRIT